MKTLKKLAIFTLTTIFVLSMTGQVKAATTVSLGTADDFAVLAGSGITNTGATTVSGDAGSSPTHNEIGFGPGADAITFASGANHNIDDPNDDATQGAQDDLTLAYLNARDQVAAPVTVVTESGSDSFAAQTNILSPGIYKSPSSMGVTGYLKLDAAGDPNAVFIFQAGTSLTTADHSIIGLANGTQACHVFWQVGSSATLGTDSEFAGNILALTDITAATGATVDGRLLARNGMVTLHSNTITAATCGAPLIHVAKTATPSSLSAGGGSVTYDYTVTNVGTVIMDNITIADNKCTPTVWGQGDADDDDRLDFDETWVYSCTTTLDNTTTNTVTVTGDANGYTATDTADVTVTVTNPDVVVADENVAVASSSKSSHSKATPEASATATPTNADTSMPVPQMPNTGMAPNRQSFPWNIFLPAGILMIVLTKLTLKNNKRII